MKQLTEHKDIRKKIFDVSSQGFESLALEVFDFQYANNSFYREYCAAIGINATAIASLQQVPFLPIQFFKSKLIKSTSFEPQVTFESSGTTGSVNSLHCVKDTAIYEESFLKAFDISYGDVNKYCIIGLLPSYLERQHSSLVFMVNELIKRSNHPQSGFYLYEHEKLKDALSANERKAQKTILIGVTYALLDFFEQYTMQLNYTIIMETGGMKGRKEELTRPAVHQQLLKNTAVKAIHSEYGMTELLSQAYSKKDGIFSCPPWMKVAMRAEDDPFEVMLPEKLTTSVNSGAINVIDLANLYSCSFIATDDRCKLYSNGDFEVLGRLDNSDIRGCSLML